MPDETKALAGAVAEELRGFSGSETFYRHWLGLEYTEGVRHLAERCGAYWLLDLIGAHRGEVAADRKAATFCVWRLTVEGGKGRVVCDDGDGRVVLRQDVAFTDFPLAEATLFQEAGVLMLPGER